MTSCINETEQNLPPVEERVNEAVGSLKSELTAPANGWKLEYQPTDESGVFYMVLKFKEDGTVTIKSDVAEEGGRFFEQTIPWRIDNGLGLELILETYGVFHYLFEQDGATFGAEFEFVYQGKSGDDLVFRSASDLTPVPSSLFFEPAESSAENLFSREIATNLMEFSTISPKALETPNPKQQIILEDANVSVLWSLDPAKRIIHAILAGSGTDFYNPSFNAKQLDYTSGYKLQNGSLMLLDPLQFTVNNQISYTIDAISFSDFSHTGPGFCSLSADDGPEYSGQVKNIGSVRMVPSLYDLEGTGFQPVADFPYSVNSFYIFDGSGNSLSDDGGMISEYFPSASGFLFYYGYASDSLPSNSVGFILDDGNGNSAVILRAFDSTTTVGNRIRIVLNDNYFSSGTFTAADQANLATVTDQIFEGEYMYVSDLPVEGLTVYDLFNPCNQFETFLVR